MKSENNKRIRIVKLIADSRDYYRPQRNCGQGNIFTPVCHSVQGGAIPACIAGGIPACLAAGLQEGGSRPTPKGEV